MKLIKALPLAAAVAASLVTAVPAQAQAAPQSLHCVKVTVAKGSFGAKSATARNNCGDDVRVRFALGPAEPDSGRYWVAPGKRYTHDYGLWVDLHYVTVKYKGQIYRNYPA